MPTCRPEWHSCFRPWRYPERLAPTSKTFILIGAKSSMPKNRKPPPPPSSATYLITLRHWHTRRRSRQRIIMMIVIVIVRRSWPKRTELEILQLPPARTRLIPLTPLPSAMKSSSVAVEVFAEVSEEEILLIAPYSGKPWAWHPIIRFRCRGRCHHFFVAVVTNNKSSLRVKKSRSQSLSLLRRP